MSKRYFSLSAVMLQHFIVVLLLLTAAAAPSDHLRLVTQGKDLISFIDVDDEVGVSLLSYKHTLLQKQEKATSGRADAKSKIHGPLSVQFFDGFDQGESTYDETFFNGEDRRLWNGRESSSPIQTPNEPGAKFFAETPSAGSTAAWQTIEGNEIQNMAVNRRAHFAEWQNTPSGWIQKYSPSELGRGGVSRPAGPNQAQWFDSDALQYDGLGRRQTPPLGTAKELLDALPGAGWVHRAVNTTLRCKEVGCTASSRLNLFDPDVEEAEFCRLSIHVHPTDYDNENSKEFVKSWRVNDHIATGICNPWRQGCNDKDAQILVPCLEGLKVDQLLSGKGHVIIEGTLNEMVDECPYDGYLLNGVAVGACMVRTTTTTTSWAEPQLDDSGEFPLIATANASLRCSKPGCEVQTTLRMDPQTVLGAEKCTMNISVVQTDFDSSVGVPEQIEFIYLEGAGNISQAITPGRNPCTDEKSGKNVTAADRVFKVITNRDVTADFQKMPVGDLLIRGKISDHVDDCASNGMLLDGLITVECKRPLPSRAQK
eukprot:TRINITY_DN64087_c0_g1_i1.p1 TRINITY_DN64087_c0_g1~~TRINITY_DN64087_c0_g1_i1.p1  ORF type:complete len:540 (+),score=98.76 TRINITY_DN64087_c0_g1_i1:66-1685(+)